MCGIVAIVRRQSTRAVPSAAQVLTLVNAAAAAFDADSVTSLDGCRASLQELNSLLLGVPGAVALLESPGLSAEIAAQLDPLMQTLTTAADDAVASGEIIGSFALTEPDAGSDAGSLQTKAIRDGGGNGSIIGRSARLPDSQRSHRRGHPLGDRPPTRTPRPRRPSRVASSCSCSATPRRWPARPSPWRRPTPTV